MFDTYYQGRLKTVRWWWPVYFRAQVLVYEETPDTALRWIQNVSVSGAPRGSVVGGRTMDGHPLYLVKAGNDVFGFYVAGNHDLRNDYAEYEYYGSHKSNNWYFLTLIYSKCFDIF